jgi:hypothetical protein
LFITQFCNASRTWVTVEERLESCIALLQLSAIWDLPAVVIPAKCQVSVSASFLALVSSLCFGASKDFDRWCEEVFGATPFVFS